MIDIHCHVLPGLDDGPHSVEAALALARAMVADGITHAIATPHIYPGKFDNTKGGIEASHNRFCQHLVEHNIPLGLGWSAEIRFSSETMAWLEHDALPSLGVLGDERLLLIELPDGHIPKGTERLITALRDHQYRTVIAHPERNKEIMHRFDRLKSLVEAGAYLQLTAASVVGQFGPRAQVTAYRSIESGWVAAIASDAHNLIGRRPRMTDAYRLILNRYGTEAASHLFWHGPSLLCTKASRHMPLPSQNIVDT